MVSGDNDRFYWQLPGFTDFLELSDIAWYRPLPEDWFVVITDVENSTVAIHEGRYKQVNAVGVASITALINASKPSTIPYVFGGDGTTACIPGSVRNDVTPALVAAKQLAAERFFLDLRIGIVSLADIRRDGREVLVGKYQPHPDYQQAMFAGDGLDHAQRLVKDPNPDNPFLVADEMIADNKIFEGFECRWNEIPSPREENISLLVQVLTDEMAERSRTYRDLLNQITRIYGQEELYHPLREQNLSLTSSCQLLSVEAGIRTAFRPSWTRYAYLLKLQILKLVGWCFMTRGVRTRSADWGQYRHNLIINTDYRKFDETLRMVISGSESQRKQLRELLQDHRASGKIVFGIHAAPSSLITCIVSDYDKDHVHFLDAASGGYAIAAQELKQQLAAMGSDN